MEWWLGIDPARTGASVLLAPDLVPSVVYCWRPRQKNGRTYYDLSIVTKAGHQRRMAAFSLHDVGMELAASVARVTGQAVWGVAAEAPYVSKINPGTGLGVAISTGELVGPLRRSMRYPLLLTRASEWRKELLGLHHRTKRDEAKRKSLGLMIQRLPGLQSLLEHTAKMQDVLPDKLDHITDAGGVAEYGYIHGAKEGTDDE